MNTQSHVLIASALFTRSGVGTKARNAAAIIGGFIPDASIFTMFIWSKIIGAPELEVWVNWYYNPPWRTWSDALHSFVVYWVIVMIGVAIARFGGTWLKTGVVMIIFALSAITHAAGDLFLHVKDGHAHFWPLSDWRFSSPVSYWDPNYYGRYFLVFEIFMAVILCTMLFRRFKGKIVRAILLLAMVAYIAVPAYFILIVKHH